MTCFIDTKHPLYIAARAMQLRNIWMGWRPPIEGLPSGHDAYIEMNRLLKPFYARGEEWNDTLARLIDSGIAAVDAAVPPPVDPTVPAIPGGNE